jgi:transposase
MQSHPFVGIDVSKDRLDIGLADDRLSWQVNNDEEGIRAAAERLGHLQPGLVVVESTGGLELAILRALRVRAIPLALVNPGRVRELPIAGTAGWTDRLMPICWPFGKAAGLQPTPA